MEMEQLIDDGLHEFIDGFQQRLIEIDRAITDDIFRAEPNARPVLSEQAARLVRVEMTFCLGIKVARMESIAIADTRITSGSEVSTAKKIAVHQGDGHAMFVLTSGLRSVRDKAITYFEERLRRKASSQLTRSYQAVNALGRGDAAGLQRGQRLADQGRIAFRPALHCRQPVDRGRRASSLSCSIPQGNWVEVSQAVRRTLIIGETRFGKPILDRALRYEASLEESLRLGVLSFNSTEASSADVGPPMDAVVYRADSYDASEHRFSAEELEPIAQFWQGAIEHAVEQSAAPFATLARSIGLDPAP